MFRNILVPIDGSALSRKAVKKAVALAKATIRTSASPQRARARNCLEAADEAIRRFPFIYATRQAAGGASYGGHLANWLQASTDRYRCLVSHAGLVNLFSQWGTSDIAYSREVGQGGPHWEDVPLWQEQNPIRYAARFRTPTLVTFGENDFRVPINNGLEYWATLQRQRVESQLVVFPEENHWILRGENSRYFYREIHDWLSRWLHAQVKSMDIHGCLRRDSRIMRLQGVSRRTSSTGVRCRR